MMKSSTATSATIEPTAAAKTMASISMEFSLTTTTDENSSNNETSTSSVDDETSSSGSVVDVELGDVKELEQEDGTKESNDNATKQLQQQPDGTFFGKVGAVYAIVAIFYILLRGSWLLAGYWWSRNSIAEIKGFHEGRNDEAAARMILNAHAFLGMALIAIIAWQYLSANYFSSKYHERLRLFHRITGRFLVAFWPICIVSGLVYQFLQHNEEGDNQVAPKVVGAAIGFFSLVNLGVGYFAIAHRPKANRNFYLHKAGMFFSMHYAIGFTLSILFVAILQLCFPHCDIGTTGEVLGSLVGFFLQSVVLFGCMFRYAPSLLSTTIVKVNIGFLAAHHCIYFLLLLGALFVAEPQAGTCFA